MKNMSKLGIIVSTAAVFVMACSSFTSEKVRLPETKAIANTGAVAHGEISAEEFDKTIKGDKLTMVDFYTTWCGPCKRMAPTIQKIKEEYANVIHVLKIDAEAQADIASRYNLEGYPTVIFFKKGQIVHNALGLQTYEQLIAVVNKHK